MENARGKSGVRAGDFFKESEEMFRAACAARRDHGYADGVAHGAQHLDVKTAFHAVRVYAVEDDLACALLLSAASPFHCVYASRHPAAL